MMKKFPAIALCCLFAASCSQERFRLNRTPSIFTNPGDVYMSVDDVLMEDDTKTEASLDEMTGLSFNWCEGDKVGVYSGEGGLALFNIRTGEGSSSAFFHGDGFELKEGNTYYALYPYDGTATASAAIPLDYSARKITGQDNLSDLIPFDYLSSSADADAEHHAVFKFRHLSSFARVKIALPASADITSVDLIPTYDPLPDALSYDIKTGNAAVSSEKVVKNIPVQNVSGDNVSFWLPFVPQDLSDAALVIGTSSSDKAYSARLGGKNLSAGKSYRWSVEASALSSTPSSSLQLSQLRTSLITSVPSGEYSGITYIGDNKYAVVHDKQNGGGITFFTIKLGSSGSVSSISYEIPAGTTESSTCRDPEGIVYVPSRNSLFVSGEGDQKILEYDMNGRPTGAELNIPADMASGKITGNNGFEALGYNAATGLFWTTTESALPKDRAYQIDSRYLIRLQSFTDSDLNPAKRYFYMMDTPYYTDPGSATYAFGIPDILALDDGSLIIMEREAYVPASTVEKFNSTTKIKFYFVDPVNDKGGILGKKLLLTINTTIASWRNYEGLCLGPALSDGTQTILLVNDSQSRYSGFLQDYLTTLKLAD